MKAIKILLMSLVLFTTGCKKKAVEPIKEKTEWVVNLETNASTCNIRVNNEQGYTTWPVDFVIHKGDFITVFAYLSTTSLTDTVYCKLKIDGKYTEWSQLVSSTNGGRVKQFRYFNY